MLDLNPIAVLKKREVKFLPIHFSKIKIDRSNFDYGIENWIKYRLKGRYFIGNTTEISNDNKMKVFTSIAFEDQKELTYFILACPFYRR